MALDYHIEKRGFLAAFVGGEAPLQKRKLEELCSQGLACKIASDNSYLLSHNCVALLDEATRRLLDLYEICPCRLRVSTINNLTDIDFQYIVEFVRPDGNAFLYARVIGAYVELGEKIHYTLNEAQYRAISKINYCNDLLATAPESLDIKMFNFVNFSEIKELLQHINAELDYYMQDNTVIVPKRLSILPEVQVDGEVLVNPLILDSNSSIINVAEDFVKCFNRKEKVDSLYRGRQAFYVVEEPMREALQAIKEKQRIKREEALVFFKNPETVFTSDIFDFKVNASSRLEGLPEAQGPQPGARALGINEPDYFGIYKTYFLDELNCQLASCFRKAGEFVPLERENDYVVFQKFAWSCTYSIKSNQLFLEKASCDLPEAILENLSQPVKYENFTAFHKADFIDINIRLSYTGELLLEKQDDRLILINNEELDAIDPMKTKKFFIFTMVDGRLVRQEYKSRRSVQEYFSTVSPIKLK